MLRSTARNKVRVSDHIIGSVASLISVRGGAKLGPMVPAHKSI
jgi:hypothetical protein